MVGGRGLVNIFLSLVSRSILMSTCPLAKMTQFEYTNSTSHVYGGFLKWWYPTTIGFNTHMGSSQNPVIVDEYSIHSYEGTFISLHYPRRKTKNPLFQCLGRTYICTKYSFPCHLQLPPWNPILNWSVEHLNVSWGQVNGRFALCDQAVRSGPIFIIRFGFSPGRPEKHRKISKMQICNGVVFFPAFEFFWYGKW